MSDAHAELSSVATSLDDLVIRVESLALRLHGDDQEGAAADLFEAERALRQAARRLEAARQRSG